MWILQFLMWILRNCGTSFPCHFFYNRIIFTRRYRRAVARKKKKKFKKFLRRNIIWRLSCLRYTRKRYTDNYFSSILSSRLFVRIWLYPDRVVLQYQKCFRHVADSELGQRTVKSVKPSNKFIRIPGLNVGQMTSWTPTVFPRRLQGENGIFRLIVSIDLNALALTWY